MKEVEIKILEIDVEKIQQRLSELGAQKSFEGELVSVVFDFPDKRFSKDEILIRLRKEGVKVMLAYKKLLNTEHAKESEEIEFEVSDFDTTAKFLNAIGLQSKKGYPMSKRRISYIIDDVHFEIDKLPDFPAYLEIEALNIDVIREWVEKLGLSVDSIKPWGVREVFNHYRGIKNNETRYGK